MTKNTTVTVVMADIIEMIIKERNSTWVNIRWSRVKRKATMIFNIYQQTEENGITKSQ
jgi:hypothetical protein